MLRDPRFNEQNLVRVARRSHVRKGNLIKKISRKARLAKLAFSITFSLSGWSSQSAKIQTASRPGRSAICGSLCRRRALIKRKLWFYGNLLSNGRSSGGRNTSINALSGGVIVIAAGGAAADSDFCFKTKAPRGQIWDIWHRNGPKKFKYYRLIYNNASCV